MPRGESVDRIDPEVAATWEFQRSAIKSQSVRPAIACIVGSEASKIEIVGRMLGC